MAEALFSINLMAFEQGRIIDGSSVSVEGGRMVFRFAEAPRPR